MVWVMVLVGFFSLFLVGTVAAESWLTEFDNVRNYDEETQTIEIRNSVLGIPFLQLDKVAEIKLNTPIKYYVPRGYQKVAEFEVTSYDDYSNAFKELELFDKKDNDKKFLRDYDFKYKTIIQVPDYVNVCDKSLSKNGTLECINYRQEQIGFKDEVVWNDLTSSDFKENDKLTIGIFTNVEKGDHIEWIPTFFGVKIKEWAEWTESLNVDLNAYYRLNESSGSVIDATGNFSATNSGATPNQPGLIGTAYNFTGTSDSDGDIIYNVSTLGITDYPFSFNAWVFSGQSQQIEAYVLAIGNPDSTNVYLLGEVSSGGSVRLRAASGGGNSIIDVVGNINNNTWVMLTALFISDTSRSLYINGVSVGNDTDNVNFDGTSASFGIGAIPRSLPALTWPFTGKIDEVGVWSRTLGASEIQQLYNDGEGITWTEDFITPPTITLIAPADTSNFSASNVTFNATVTDDVEVSEVKLFIDGAVNDTNTSLVNGTYIYNLDFVDGNHNWSIGATDDMGTTENSSVRTFTIDTVAPVITNQNITEADENGIISIHVLNTNLTFTWNVSDLTSDLDTCTFNHDGNVTVTCSDNSTSFNITDFSNRNLTFFANDTLGQESNVSVSWDYNVSQFESTFSATTFETKTETFAANITLGAGLNGTTISNVRLFHNGSGNTGAIATNTAGQNYNLSHTIDIGIIGTGVSDWLFSFDADGVNVNTTTQTQTVTELLFQLCNATHSTQFINFTFRNETTNEEAVSASVSSTWVFYLGQGLINKTLTFSNTTENLNYSFCCSAINDILTTTSSMAYTNPISQQRIFEPTLLTLTDVTDERTLYLLPTFKGLFSQFRTEDTLSNSIVGATGVITRILNGVLIDITSDATDGSGLVLFFLDPDITYTATFSAAGFDDNTFTFIPTTDLRTVVMGGEVVAVEGSEISLGMSYNITPTNTTLNNGTDVLFQFNVTSTETITFMGFDISNGTAVLLSRSQASNGSLSGTLNTGNHSRLTGVYTISTTNETITITRIWGIDQSFIGDYSIFRQFNLYMDYGFEDFGRLLIVLLVIAGAMMLMSKEIGVDEEVKMVVGILIVWAFSVVGWLDTGIVVETASSGINDLTQFSNQYGIAMVSTIAAAYFILRRVFRQI